MSVTAPSAQSVPISEEDKRLLRRYFEQTRPLPQLLATLRSRRVAQGYSIESGEEEHRSATGRSIRQEPGPLAFTSSAPVMPLTEVEEAIITWSACGPNG